MSILFTCRIGCSMLILHGVSKNERVARGHRSIADVEYDIASCLIGVHDDPELIRLCICIGGGDGGRDVITNVVRGLWENRLVDVGRKQSVMK